MIRSRRLFVGGVCFLGIVGAIVSTVCVASDSSEFNGKVKKAKDELAAFACEKAEASISKSYSDSTVRAWLDSCNDSSALKNLVMRLKSDLDRQKRANKKLGRDATSARPCNNSMENGNASDEGKSAE